MSSECPCGWMCVGFNALGSDTCLVQGEWPEQDAVQHQQLSQWEYFGEEIIQGTYSSRYCCLPLINRFYTVCLQYTRVSDDFIFCPKDPLIKGQRCVILADGFYEWKRLEKNKQPFFIYFPQGPTQKKTESVSSKKNSETECPPKEASKVCISFFIALQTFAFMENRSR